MTSSYLGGEVQVFQPAGHHRGRGQRFSDVSLPASAFWRWRFVWRDVAELEREG